MKTFLGLICICCSFIACDKVDNEAHTLSGTYIGIFNRTGMDTAQVSLHFSGHSFEGQSNRSKYPAICHGKVELGKSMISFTDSCSWTADFDWSLVLSGKYNISFADKMVRIWKTDGIVTDEYLLRQPL
jgi:hypothetical protein